jgi:hypothetical protein
MLSTRGFHTLYLSISFIDSFLLLEQCLAYQATPTFCISRHCDRYPLSYKRIGPLLLSLPLRSALHLLIVLRCLKSNLLERTVGADIGIQHIVGRPRTP